MTMIERPDLSDVAPDVLAYIEALETELLAQKPTRDAPEPEPSEPPTTLNVITITADNMAKRTPRHLYSRQRRGGMGVFDLETAETAPPTTLVIADEEESILLFTDLGRGFRLPVNALSEEPVRAAGQSLANLLPFRANEHVVAALPGTGGAYVALVSERGRVRRIRSNYVGNNLIPGSTFHDVKQGGYLAAACWTSGEGDLFLATRQGKGIRFRESQVHSSGTLGMRVDMADRVVAITAVMPTDGVFMMSGEGKGTVRLMSGFSANKAPGAGGKIALKTDQLVAAATVQSQSDVFAISQLSKIIRFSAAEIPQKTGVVQGVNCMTLRNDRVTGCVVT